MTERYRKLIARRQRIAVLYALIGVCTLILLFLVRETAIVPAYMSPCFTGAGFSMLVSGVVSFYRRRRLLADDEALRKAAVAEYDERNIEVMRRACVLALNVMLVTGYAAMLVAAFISQIVCYTLLSCICAGLAITFFCYAIVAKRV